MTCRRADLISLRVGDANGKLLLPGSVSMVLVVEGDNGP